MAERNRVFFKSVEEAEAAGYERAGNCPAEEQVGLKKTSPDTGVVQPTSSAAGLVPSASSGTPRPSVAVPAKIQADPGLISPNGNSVTDRSSDGRIVGNKNSKIYHLPGCSSYSKVSERNQVRFDSVEAAQKAGYKLAGNCSPDKNTRQ